MVFPLGDNERTRIVPVATYTLIALNVLAFFLQMDRGEQFTTAFAATPYEITHNFDIPEPFVMPHAEEEPRILRADTRDVVIDQAPVPFPVWFTLLTSIFLHGGLMHLAGNMLYLWIFGDNVEEVLGSVRFVIVYLCCGLAASMAQILANPDSVIPTLGASGAIAGVMGAYLIWFPRNRVRVLFLYNVIEVPALLMIGLWIGAQIWQSLGSFGRAETGGVAYLAHVAGAASGVLVGFLFRELARMQGHTTWFDPPRYSR